MNDSDQNANQSRRGFLRGLATGTAATALGAGVRVAESADAHWDAEVDVLVVGGGAAGCSAAVTAHDLGSTVMVLEKGPVLGGTSAKSVGGFWIPNNRVLREAGTVDPRADCLKLMVRLSFPDHYDTQAEFYGAEPVAYRQMEAYYDQASQVVEKLEQQGALRLVGLDKGFDIPDYFAHLPENKVPVGRAMIAANADGSFGSGATMMRQFSQALAQRHVTVKTHHRAKELIKDRSGRVIGLVAEKRDGAPYRVKVTRGVIFTTGGFTHNKQMRVDFLKGPVFGGCASPNSEGDFVYIGTQAGVQLGNMSNAWWAQLSLEEALENPSVSSGIWTSPGDSMIQVNRLGRRFCDEKFVYNERTQAHFEWDPISASFPNLLSFLIYDQRSADVFAGFNPIPPKGSSPKYLMVGQTMDDLVLQIKERLGKVATATGGLSLAKDFRAQLKRTIEQFNRFAEKGVDTEFGRGEQRIDRWFHFYGPTRPPANNGYPNPTMHPIATKGPYYAIILAAGTLDTKGGPKTNEHAQVLGTQGGPIPGLYGAGNCIASCAGPAYWSGGCTLGAALTFGSIAATHATKTASIAG